MYLVILAVHSAEGPAPLWQNTGICQAFTLHRKRDKWNKVTEVVILSNQRGGSTYHSG